MRPFALSCNLSESESMEERLNRVLYALKQRGAKGWRLTEIDATGPLGQRCTRELNSKLTVNLDAHEMEILTKERGQVLELKADSHVADGTKVRILIRDGMSLDVLGFGALPSREHVGDYTTHDPRMFLWDVESE